MVKKNVTIWLLGAFLTAAGAVAQHEQEPTKQKPTKQEPPKWEAVKDKLHKVLAGELKLDRELRSALVGHWRPATSVLAEMRGKPDADDAQTKRLSKLRKTMLGDFVRVQGSTGAIFAGQYNGLALLGDDVRELILDLIENPPQDVSDPMRAAMMSALRDCCRSLGDKDVARIRELLDDEFEDENLQQMCEFVLYHFGHKDRLQKRIQQKVEQAEKENTIEAWAALAQFYWQMRDYAKAVEIYQKAAPLAKDLDERAQATFYYNMCCSQSLAGQLDGAFANLDTALSIGGLADVLLIVDHDINNLRKDERFAELLKKHGRDLVLAQLKKKEKAGQKD